MSIRQHCLEDFDEDIIYSNDQGKGNCVNCHSFCRRDVADFANDSESVHLKYRKF